MAQVDMNPVQRPSCPAFGETQRKDIWWTGPLATALGLGAFGIYATFRAVYNNYYQLGHGTGLMEEHAFLLSPFYSPLLVWNGMPAWLSPAFLILWAPGGFRLTCYYYRKAYYRAFFADPPACAVGEPGSLCGIKRGLAYKGETRVLLFQNLHRYFMYFALIFLVLLSIDIVHSCLWPTTSGGFTFGVSVGTVVLLANVVLLSLYTFSCHSLRHLVGGGLDSFSKTKAGPIRYRLWKWASALNVNHMQFAWASLFSVGFADFYVWMVSAGIFADLRFF